MTATADKMIEAFLNDGMEPDVAAQSAFDSCKKTELRDYVVPLFHRRAKEISRTLARRVEDLVMDLNPPEERAVHRVEAVQRICVTTFSLPDGRRVAWAEASARDHLDRAEWLAKGARNAYESEMETVRRHEVAADLLRKKRKKCLGDIPDWQEALAAAVGGVSEAA